MIVWKSHPGDASLFKCVDDPLIENEEGPLLGEEHTKCIPDEIIACYLDKAHQTRSNRVVVYLHSYLRHGAFLVFLRPNRGPLSHRPGVP